MNNFLQEVKLCTYSICRKELATRLAKTEENINQVFDIIVEVEEPNDDSGCTGFDEYGNPCPVECDEYGNCE